MTYADLLRRAALIPAGDRQSAGELLPIIASLLDSGDGVISTDQRRRLYKLRKKWAERADGRDPRWSKVGSKPGRPSSRSASARPRNEEEHDPLLASIMRKYSTPRDIDGL